MIPQDRESDRWNVSQVSVLSLKYRFSGRYIDQAFPCKEFSEDE